MQNEVLGQLFRSGRSLGECFYILNFLVVVVVLNQGNLLKRSHELEGKINISQKLDVLKCRQNVTRNGEFKKTLKVIEKEIKVQTSCKQCHYFQIGCLFNVRILHLFLGMISVLSILI